MRLKEQPVDSIPEVMEFKRAMDRLEKFKAMNRDFFEELDLLVLDYNRTREVAERTVREQQVSCGPFKLMGRPAIKWDGTKLVNEVGKDIFFDIGGTAETSVVYKIDNKLADAAASQGMLTEETVTSCRKVTARYSKPDKVVLP